MSSATFQNVSVKLTTEGAVLYYSKRYVAPSNINQKY